MTVHSGKGRFILAAAALAPAFAPSAMLEFPGIELKPTWFIGDIRSNLKSVASLRVAAGSSLAVLLDSLLVI
jgi:hypothetical protein